MKAKKDGFDLNLDLSVVEQTKRLNPNDLTSPISFGGLTIAEQIAKRNRKMPE
jgi:hypothetical protein